MASNGLPKACFRDAYQATSDCIETRNLMVGHDGAFGDAPRPREAANRKRP
jgi:hypothetical protein